MAEKWVDWVYLFIPTLPDVNYEMQMYIFGLLGILVSLPKNDACRIAVVSMHFKNSLSLDASNTSCSIKQRILMSTFQCVVSPSFLCPAY